MKTKPVHTIVVRKSGILYIVISIVMGLLAINGGNNFHYLVAAAILGYMLASGVAGRRNIRRAEVSLSFPDEVYARTSFMLGVKVRNKGRRPIFLIDVRVRDSHVFFPIVQPGETLTKPLALQLTSRGVQDVSDIELSSAYPFDFFTRYWPVSFKGHVIVFPEPIASDNRAGTWLSSPDEYGAIRDKLDAERDVAGVRPYAEGDSMRTIHWKSTARTGRLKSRMYDDSGETGTRVIDLDALLASGKERGLSAASHEISLAIKSGLPIGLKDGDAVWLPSGSRSDKLYMLTNLALYE
ncbi:MAG: DUF58 domain-containing protein [Synergistaceae bacterium]|nr:DUF58 domain-containing protein [Synergistaceae bacterium]